MLETSVQLGNVHQPGDHSFPVVSYACRKALTKDAGTDMPIRVDVRMHWRLILGIDDEGDLSVSAIAPGGPGASLRMSPAGSPAA